MRAIIAITRNGVRIGARLQEAFPGSDLFALDRYACGRARPFSDGVRALVGRLWNEYDGFVLIAATGIAVRAIAPLLVSKDRDPAVVVIDDAGRFAVSLLSGHLGGANELARNCADSIGAVAVITTATDANDLPSFDMVAKEHGWAIDDLSKVKLLNALLLEGEEIAVCDPSGSIGRYFCGRGSLSFHETVEEGLESGCSGFVCVTDRLLPEPLPERLLVLRPRRIFLGIGCNRGTSAAEIESVVTENLQRLSLSLNGVGAVATAKAKQDEAGLLEFAAAKNLPLLFFRSDELNEVAAPSPPSGYALTAIGAKGVAEPAALLASKGGRLILNKVRSGNVTIAIAVGSFSHP